jgi:SAM-dependent methyltransferase
MQSDSQQYQQYLSGKYLPGRGLYLRMLLYPKYLRELSQGAEGPAVDLGCGTGEFLDYCRGRGVPATGVDANPHLVEMCRAKGLTVTVGDILSYVPESPVRRAVCDNVLEHLDREQLVAFFGNFRQIAAPGARLLVIVPGNAGYRSDPTHKTFVTPELICELAEQHRFTVVRRFYMPLNRQWPGNWLYLNMAAYTLLF